MITHHPNCTPNYPEKPVGEKPQEISREIFDGFFIDTCVDCGAFETNLPAEDDPYWDEAKEGLKRLGSAANDVR